MAPTIGRGHLFDDDTATGGDRGGDTCLGLVVWQPDVEMDPVALRGGASICWEQTTEPVRK